MPRKPKVGNYGQSAATLQRIHNATSDDDRIPPDIKEAMLRQLTELIGAFNSLTYMRHADHGATEVTE